jgi:hypothetical protein
MGREKHVEVTFPEDRIAKFHDFVEATQGQAQRAP